jgi:hypothetical protein
MFSIFCVLCVFYVSNLQFVGWSQGFVWRGEWKMEQKKSCLNLEPSNMTKDLHYDSLFGLAFKV